MATAAGRRDRWLWIFLWWGLVALVVMRDGRREGEEGRSDQRCFSDWMKKGLTTSSVTIADFRNPGIKELFCLFVFNQRP